MKLADALQKAKDTQPDGCKATVEIDEPWRCGEKLKTTHSPGIVSLDYLREHSIGAEVIEPEPA